MKCPAGWITNRNQDCQEKYQQPQIHRWYSSNGRKPRETQEPLDEVKEESVKAGLKLNIKKNLRSWHPDLITSWQIGGKTVADIIFLGSKSLQMFNLDNILKSRDITLLTKVHIVKAMVFPVVKYGCENWTIKKAEYWRIDALELRCWRKLLRVPWTARRSNQSILKEISPGISLEGMMLKLKLQYFGHLMQKLTN